MTTRSLLGALLVSTTSLVATPAAAQPVGTFRWQLRPYCNVVTVAVTQNGGVYRLEGTDDQCGAGSGPASVIGTAFPNPDGTIGIGLNIVAAPGGTPSPVHATLTLSTLGGTWRDGAGQTGAFVFTPGAGTGGSPRSSGGTIGAVAIDPAQVQLRVSGSCAAGLFMQSIGQAGTVGCAAAGGGGGGITGVSSGAGLTGGGTSGAVSLALRTAGSGTFDFTNPNGIVAAGMYNSGSIGVSGEGTRLLWYPRKAAFRVGLVSGSQWDDPNIGGGSTAMGYSTTASGNYSTALGAFTTAGGQSSTAMGDRTTASGGSSTAMGELTTASGNYSTAMGFQSTASGSHSTAMGFRSTASGVSSTATGILTVAAGLGSTVMGTYAEATSAAPGSFVYGDRSTVGSAAMIRSTAPNEFVVRATGGVGFYTSMSPVIGVELSQNGSGWMNVSDVNVKTNFRDLADDDVLAKIAAMPVREWNYVTQDASIRHVGPTAQDFRAAFGLGESARHINTIDADGIALAAVKALEARTRALPDEARALRVLVADLARDNNELRGRLARLEALIEKR